MRNGLLGRWLAVLRRQWRDTRVPLLTILILTVAAAWFGWPRQDDKPDQYQPQETAEQERIEIDRQIARYNRWLAMGTGILAASTIGLWIVTWRASIKQSRDMRKSIAAAKVSATIAREALTKLERAFVSCTNQELIQAPNGDYIIQLRFTNNGKTATKYAVNHFNWQYFDDDMPTDFDFPDFGDHGPFKIFIGPGNFINFGPLQIDANRMHLALQGTGHLYMWAWCEYDDIFDDTPRHRSEYCGRIKPIHHPVALNEQMMAVAASITYHSAFNGADEDCTKAIQTGSPKNPLPYA